MRANIVQLDMLPSLFCDGETSTFYLYVCFSLHCFHLKNDGVTGEGLRWHVGFPRRSPVSMLPHTMPQYWDVRVSVPDKGVKTDPGCSDRSDPRCSPKLRTARLSSDPKTSPWLLGRSSFFGPFCRAFWALIIFAAIFSEWAAVSSGIKAELWPLCTRRLSSLSAVSDACLGSLRWPQHPEPSLWQWLDHCSGNCKCD